MCGILSVLNLDKRPIDEALLIRMRDTMFHRGPDDAGIYIDGPLGLAHRRLSIIDLSDSGHQPMTNEDQSIVLVFNGEIYNYKELKKGLQTKGHKFASNSDTEVILHQYEEDREDCLAKFNGMFSFVLWDSNKKRIFAARDRLGIKPLYYYFDGKKLVLASEIKAIIEDPDIPRAPNYQAIADYLFAGRALGDKTVFQNVKEVEPAHFLLFDQSGSDHPKIRRYWDIEYDYNYSRRDNQASEELFTLLDDAVKIHCRSDAPLGCHLSGGIDSSTIVAFAARHRDPLKTFSIKFSDDPYIDETKYAKAVARHVGAQYLESNPTSTDLASLLPTLMWHMDIPMATDGGFSYYTVSKLAKENAKVSLTGHGGDEIFAGYPAQFQGAYNRTDMFSLLSDPYRFTESSLIKKTLKRFGSQGPTGIFKAIKSRLIKHPQTFEETWIQLHCSASPEYNMILHKDFIRQIQGYSSRDDYLRPFAGLTTDQLLDKGLYHDLTVYLPSLLHLEDRVSMALSIESRVPLLDYRIPEFLATVPPNQKINGMIPKHLIRQCASSLLPEDVLNRKDKFPFPVPVKFWSSAQMEGITRNILLSPESLNRGVFKKSALKEALSSKNMIWQLLNIELWFKTFIDNKPEHRQLFL